MNVLNVKQIIAYKMSCVSQILSTANLYFLIQINRNVFYNVMLGTIKMQNPIYVKNVVQFLVQIVLSVQKNNVYFAKINI